MKFNVTVIFYAVFFTLTVFLSSTIAYPAGEEDLIAEHASYEPLEEVHYRVRRASCDLFSFSSQWVTPNHAVCAAHCIALGKRGGECKGTVCHCRA